MVLSELDNPEIREIGHFYITENFSVLQYYSLCK